MNFQKTALHCAIALTALSLAACGGGGDSDTTPLPPPITSVQVGEVVALTVSGTLGSFNRATPGTKVGSVAVTGLATGETLLGIDVRPANSKLYALGSAGNLYTLDPATGVATLKIALKALAGDDNPYAGLVGASFAVDFNPVADRLRVIGNSGQNLRINVDTGDTITDGAITPVRAFVTAAAYTNSFAGTTSTRLFDLDVAAGQLHLQNPPNDGVLANVVTLGVTADAANGFDIDARTNLGYAVLTTGNETAFYSINLAATANAATKIGVIGSAGDAIRGVVLMATAAPTALALTADNRLAAFNPSAPNTITSTTPISGLGSGEVVLGVDFRPRDGMLYGLATGGRLYTINPTTGVATFRAMLMADPTDATAPYTSISGTVTSVDFNPAADRLRVITSTGQSLRIVVETATTGATTVTAGNTITDGAINRVSGAASVVASAYTNSFAGTTATMLHNLEQNNDVLTLQNPPNDGTLTNIGALGVDITGTAGFDIGGGDNGLILAALRVGTNGPFSLYNVSLATGAATLYRNTSGNAALSFIGGATGPANLIDIAIRF